MPDAWIQLQCPACDQNWERDPADLPNPDADFSCQHCGEGRPMAEFTKTQRDLEMLQQFP